MECSKIKELLSLYIDDELSLEQRLEVERHLEDCEGCQSEYQDLIAIRELLAQPMVDLPVGFKEELHEKLIEAKENTDNGKNNVINIDMINKDEILDRVKDGTDRLKGKRNFKKLFNYKAMSAVAAVFLIMVSSVFILDNGGMYDKSADFATEEAPQEMNMAADEPKAMDDGAKYGSRAGNKNGTAEAPMFRADDTTEMRITHTSEGSNDNVVTENLLRSTAVENRKIITNANLQIETENYDETLDKIIHYTESVGGYVENSESRLQNYYSNKKEESLKEGYISIRVPAAVFKNTYDKLLEVGVVVDQSVSTDDITLQYRETFDRAENLKVQEKRLREIMLKAEDVKDVIEVERELTRVRGEIDALTNRINRWDNLVSLSTIHISLREVPKLNEITAIDDNIFTKAKKGFIRSINRLINYCERLFINAVTAIPILTVWLIGLFVIYIVIRKFYKKLRRD